VPAAAIEVAWACGRWRDLGEIRGEIWACRASSPQRRMEP